MQDLLIVQFQQNRLLIQALERNQLHKLAPKEAQALHKDFLLFVKLPRKEVQLHQQKLRNKIQYQERQAQAAVFDKIISYN